MSLNDRLQAALTQRKVDGNFRQLKIEAGIDFFSNDYLGYAGSAELQALISAELLLNKDQPTGSRGSRLLAGNSAYCMNLEYRLAEFFDQPASLLFNSGFDANLSLLSSVPVRNDTIIYDELVHASIHAGMRLGNARAIKFNHNDANSLREKIALATGNIFVVVESLYSMDGDLAPLALINEICLESGASLIIDEAHSTGIFGLGGRGIVHDLNLQLTTFAVINTFGKAMGAHGACISGSEVLKDYLVNFARPFIYSTALSFHALACISKSIAFAAADRFSRLQLAENIALFRKSMIEYGIVLNEAPGPVQTIIIPGNENCKIVSQCLGSLGFAVRAILAPTVAAGTERLRICIHAFNKPADIQRLVNVLCPLIRKSSNIAAV